MNAQPFSHVLLLAMTCGGVALLTAAIFRILIGIRGTGTEKMEATARHIRCVAVGFLRRQYGLSALVVVILGILLYLFLDGAWDAIQMGSYPLGFIAGSFVLGALCSGLAGGLGLRTALSANARAAQAARTGLGPVVRVSFLSGAVSGLCVVGLSLLGLAGVFLWLTEYAGESIPRALTILVGFAFGASVMALCARVGGGIFADAGKLSADITHRTERGIQEGDAHSPAVIVAASGKNIVTAMGMGADFFESHSGAILATMLIGLTVDWGSGTVETAILFPLYVAALGVIASIVGTFVVRTRRGHENIHGALKGGVFLASVIVAIGAYFLARSLLPAWILWGVFSALIAGLLAGLILCMLAEYMTSGAYSPARKLAHASQVGPTSSIVNGFGLGYGSAFVLVLVLCLAIVVAYLSAGLYGIALGAVGMLSSLGITLATSAFGHTADNAGTIAGMAQLPRQVRVRTDALSMVGSATAAIGRAFSIASAALTVLALIAVFGEAVSLPPIDILDPLTLVGLLVGAAVPFLFCSMGLHAVHRASSLLTEEIRRQFREIKGLAQGKAEADNLRCMRAASGNIVNGVSLPILIAIVLPIGIGLSFGSVTLAAFLVGSLASGIVLAFALTGSGGAWENARIFIEFGNLGGKEGDAHRATALGSAVGDSLKNTAGASLAVYLKFMTIVAVLTAGFMTGNGLF